VIEVPRFGPVTYTSLRRAVTTWAPKRDLQQQEMGNQLPLSQVSRIATAPSGSKLVGALVGAGLRASSFVRARAPSDNVDDQVTNRVRRLKIVLRS
jgi:hypothetical protein